MTTPSETSSSTTVSWTDPDDQLLPPIVSHVPYIEVKLEHPDLEEMQFSNAFFPEAVPYQLGDDEYRVFYWRPSLPASIPDVATWSGVCATTHELTPIVNENTATPCLLNHHGDAYEVVVDGTIAGESLTTELQQYQPPDISIHCITPERTKIEAATQTVSIPTGTCTTMQLPDQVVSLVDNKMGETRVAPQLRIRFPGQRTIYHPAPEAEYAIFPSFNLDIGDLPNPVRVPLTDVELDYIALASQLGINLSDRPYPERVLWQAFAYQVFDPRRETEPKLTQSNHGLLLLQNPKF